jgi:hypothetical protein
MRRYSAAAAIGAVTMGVAMALAPTAASAAVERFTFNDVVLPDGQVGEITANIKETNKANSVYCGYFSDDFRAFLGYYFALVETVPADGDALLALCLDRFDNRNT